MNFNQLCFGTALLAAIFSTQACAPKPQSAAGLPKELRSLKIAYNVYHRKETDDYEVFSMNPDGTGRKNISNSPGVDWTYFACKDKVYFVSDRDTCHRCYFLYETDSEGSYHRKISEVSLEDSWFSTRNDGSEMVVRPKAKQDSAFYIINLASGKILSKIYPKLPYLNDPFFSPDGRQIVFRGSYSKSGREKKHFDELFMMNADGSGLRQLTTYPKSDTTASWFDYHAGAPFWEPNGNFISYLSRQKGNTSIFRIKPDGSAPHQLTPDTANEGWHAWSPDGKWVVYDGSDLADSNYDIYLMRADGSGVRRLTTDSKSEFSPVFVLAKK